VNNHDWTIFVAGAVLGAVGGGWLGNRWRDLVDGGTEWLIAVCAAIGVIAIIVGGYAVASGWQPWA
jgi:uncharacterized membrane protein YoaK (UPF0700 family)